jgi:hypothetical protein
MDQMVDIRAAASENVKARLRAKYGVKEIHNPLFSLQVDLYRYRKYFLNFVCHILATVGRPQLKLCIQYCLVLISIF